MPQGFKGIWILGLAYHSYRSHLSKPPSSSTSPSLATPRGHQRRWLLVYTSCGTGQGSLQQEIHCQTALHVLKGNLPKIRKIPKEVPHKPTLNESEPKGKQKRDSKEHQHQIPESDVWSLWLSPQSRDRAAPPATEGCQSPREPSTTMVMRRPMAEARRKSDLSPKCCVLGLWTRWPREAELHRTKTHHTGAPKLPSEPFVK